MFKPLSESRSVFLLHRNKLHTHTFFGFAPLDDGAYPYLSSRHIEQQLYGTSRRRRVRGPNVQPAQSKIGDMRNVSHARALPGHGRTFG